MNLHDELTTFMTSLSHLSDHTKGKYYRRLSLFLTWLLEEKLLAHRVRTVDILAFIDTLKADYTPEHQNRILYTIKTWYDHKGYQRNPALGINLRYHRSKVVHGLLDRKGLDKLYHGFTATTLNGYRNKVIIGLLVFQALSTGDLHRLQTHQVDLSSVQLHVPGSNQTNRRTLPLVACQVMEMKTYLEEIRPQLITAPTDQLILSRKGTRLQNVLHDLFKALRKEYSNIKHAQYLRQSVIAEWLKEKDVRIVQYLAGHKKVESTERYESLQLEDLQEQLNQYHPLG